MNGWQFLDKNLWALISGAVLILWSVENILTRWPRRRGNREE